MRLGTAQDLRSVYRQPNRGPIDKVIHRLDHHCADFLSKSPFFVLSTANADGVCDGSPKGGPPGFVEVLDEQRLAWADYSGNNRLDSFENLVTNASVALLFLIPGLDETLRVNGTADLVTDAALCDRFAVGDKPARVVVVVTVAEAYVHCAKALRRAELWAPDSWLDPGDLPSGSCMVKDHAHVDLDVAVIEARAAHDALGTGRQSVVPVCSPGLNPDGGRGGRTRCPRVGEHDPRLLTLTDVDAAGAEAEQARQLLVLVAPDRAHVDVQAVLDRLRLRHARTRSWAARPTDRRSRHRRLDRRERASRGPPTRTRPARRDRERRRPTR